MYPKKNNTFAAQSISTELQKCYCIFIINDGAAFILPCDLLLEVVVAH